MTPIQQIASDLAPELDRLINAYIETMKFEEPRATPYHAELTEFLWDNKVGLLRVLQAVDPSGRRSR